MYEVHALKYAELRNRSRGEIFVGDDLHDSSLDMDYFIWLAVADSGPVVIDTGFTADMAKKRGRTFLHAPSELLSDVGVRGEEVAHVIVTHLHYDHAGNFDLFPNARFHIQDSEMAYATGRQMTHAYARKGFEVEDVIAMIRHVYAERVVFHDGHGKIVPGVEVHHIGGHTRGLQSVTVETARGTLVLASDAAHYYESFEQGRVFALVDSVGGMLEGYRRLQKLAAQPELIIPGHDPEVMRRYPASRPHLEGKAVRLDVAAVTS